MPKVKTRIMNNSWLRQREIGQRFPLGYADRFSKRLYSSILPCTSWDHGENLRHAMHGGVFNLEFSPDGSLLVAACEKKSILMFDPLCRRLIHAVDNAHRDCVNCVRFLDSRVFATCSDDSTVALWDARNLKSQIRTLHGHSNWVKNIEFSPRDGLLVTSGFDGSIYTWDINSNREIGLAFSDKPPAEEQEEMKDMAYIPFYGPISGKIGRLLRKHGIKTIHKPPTKIQNLLRPVKDDLGLRTPGVYEIPCECGKCYIGQTGRTIMERCKEHQHSIRLYYSDKSAVAQHSLESGHKIDFGTFLNKTSGYWDFVIKEAIEIQLDGNNFNRDGDLQLSTAWKPAINTLRPPAHGRQSGPASRS
ncbi:hypothetical protein ANN_13010 [Periplaneta americana]|uniref:Uncharacterized protein n=1 Tax=Periplaneta americana TaxID=6978 RepID=A0ABQ8TKE7_PERAM|nr:hypothetical protein ANN_13010 [Periplaneta americana]